MLKKEFRLRQPVRTFSRTFTTQLFTLRVADNNLSYNRYGFIVSKRISALATKRNRVRRVFRSCIEAMVIQIKTGYDMVFILRKKATELSRNDLCIFLETFLKSKGFA